MKQKIKDGTCTNTAVANLSFSGLLKYVRESIHLWEKFPVVWNLSQFSLDKNDDPSDMVRELLLRHKGLAKQRTGQRTAFVVAKEYDYGMFRMFCTLSEIIEYPLELNVFKSLREAHDWVKGPE